MVDGIAQQTEGKHALDVDGTNKESCVLGVLKGERRRKCLCFRRVQALPSPLNIPGSSFLASQCRLALAPLPELLGFQPWTGTAPSSLWFCGFCAAGMSSYRIIPLFRSKLATVESFPATECSRPWPWCLPLYNDAHGFCGFCSSREPYLMKQ